MRLFCNAMMCLLCLVYPAAASETAYVTATSLDLTRLLAPPPADGSDEDRADLQAVLTAQANASPERRRRAIADTQETVFDMFTPTLGSRFDAAALPATTTLFERLGQTEGAVTDPVKPYFHRVRPWIAHTEVEAIARPSESFSYPSGHATRVTMAAIVLSALVPEQRRLIWKRAGEYAQSRVVGGMHYPSDIQMSARAATAIVAITQLQPAFQTDFAAALAELRPALNLGPLSP